MSDDELMNFRIQHHQSSSSDHDSQIFEVEEKIQLNHRNYNHNDQMINDDLQTLNSKLKK